MAVVPNTRGSEVLEVVSSHQIRKKGLYPILQSDIQNPNSAIGSPVPLGKQPV
jgi:hypothetical protein